jgi:glyoxylase-like metal-dependent hydrolase (beta-lactamase superfamily II)/acyl carrier protein
MTAGLSDAEVARLKRQGLGFLEPSTALDELGEALARGVSEVTVVPLNVGAMDASAVPPLLQGLVRRGGAGRGSDASVLSLAEILKGLREEERLTKVQEVVREDIARVMALPSAEAVGPDVPVKDLGMDSLMAMELRNTLVKRVGKELPATLALDYPTARALAEHLLEDCQEVKSVDVVNYSGLRVATITVGPFQENCYILADEATGKAIVVDPGDEEGRILAAIRRLEVDVQEIINTHVHVDHVGAVAGLKRALGVPFAIHAGDQQLVAGLTEQAAMLHLEDPEKPAVDRHLAHRETIEIGHITGTILHTPGHSPGACCLLFPEQRVVFVGDTILPGAVGSLELPGGSASALLASIRDHFVVLDDDIIVCSGHGLPTTVGVERRSNPFLQPGWLKLADAIHCEPST